MERKLFIIMLLSLMTMGVIESKAQDFRHKHEPREQRMFCLSDEKFTILYNKVKNTSFDAPKMDLIEVASLGAFYSCEQCASIMSIFSFGDKKLAALRLMAPRIIDPHRAYLIYDKLTFQSEKDEAARIIYIYYSDNQADRCPLVLTGTFGVDAEVSRGRACARSLGIERG